MDYLFENLGEDRFQELCQSLLVKEFPNVQCFPVRQPDGGRDAVAYYDPGNREGKRDRPFNVFQIKYVRKPLAETDPHNWLSGIMAKEAPKLADLVPKGAKAYYLITNVPGTSHRNVGAIDKVSKILCDGLKETDVKSFTWWRDDVSRRLDNAYDLKWVYPEVMTGPDLLRLIIEEGLGEHKQRRGSAIRAFVRKQYDDDEDVRFKQIELHNKLLELFVDVPIATHSSTPLTSAERYHSIEARQIEIYCSDSSNPKPIGAATALLNRWVQTKIPQLVLEGAPGQGKSTLSQYVCQVHRMRILEEEAFAFLPAEHQPNSVRIPFKVDLRDLATWFSKQDPFTPEEKKPVPDQWAPSLEAFLAAQVRHHSGGVDFTVSDLHAVAKLSAILLVLDGLDEVADIRQREEVVRQIVSGSSRLREIAASLQVLVTSRPTAFTTSVGFPEKHFPHLHLDSLSSPLILAYAEKWNKTQRLSQREASEVTKILRQKIEQPHLRDLARNPMQLSILLSLIKKRGTSLPDKRTALYDGYVDLFFDREAEKHAIVRENRELLIDIHRYLGWFLHSNSEKAANKSRIGFDSLQTLLREYLVSEEQEDSSVSDLFTAMKERIVFIVSRVEGTFEFEVQPLREYFAAQHLYVTAPYAPSGSARKGTLPDRFDGIARSPYWLNVTRFFAGCFDKGELPCLVDRLRFLSESDEYQNTNLPQRLAAMLLGDWVFSEDQRSTRTAVALVLEGVGLRHPLANRRRKSVALPEEFVLLPSKCGREELIRKCFEILASTPPEDYAIESARLLNSNATRNETDEFWRTHIETIEQSQMHQWLKYGLFLGSLSRCPIELIDKVTAGKQLEVESLEILLNAGRSDYIEASEERCETLVRGILGGTVRDKRRNPDLLARFWGALDPYQYCLAFREPVPVPLSELQRRRYGASESPNGDFSPSNSTLKACAELIKLCESESQRNAVEWATDLAPWSVIVEASRRMWGEQLAHYALANSAAGIRSAETTCKEYPDLLDHSKALCPRVRYARLRAGNHQWWTEQFAAANAELDHLLVPLVFCSWASIPTFIRLFELVGDFLTELSTSEWSRVFYGIRAAIPWTPSTRSLKLKHSSLPEHLSGRLVIGLAANFKWEDRLRLYTRYLSDYVGDDLTVLSFCAQTAIQAALMGDATKWPPALEFVQKLYKAELVFPSHDINDYHYYGRANSDPFPVEVAKQIAEHPEKYPRHLVFAAAERCQAHLETQLPRVVDTAADERWFEREDDRR